MYGLCSGSLCMTSAVLGMSCNSVVYCCGVCLVCELCSVVVCVLCCVRVMYYVVLWCEWVFICEPRSAVLGVSCIVLCCV